MVTKFIKKQARNLIGALLGGGAGFAYYWYVGCATGTCPITSNPYISIIYGAVLGVLLIGLFRKKEQPADEEH